MNCYEKLNISCAYESERQDKRKMAMPQCSAAIHSAQSSSTPIEIRKETPVQQNNIKMQPDILSEFREVRSNMALLSDLRAEVSQIKEFIKKPQYFHVQHLNSAGGQQDNIIQQVIAGALCKKSTLLFKVMSE